MRVVQNRKASEKHYRRIDEVKPKTGVVRLLRLTDRNCSFENMLLKHLEKYEIDIQIAMETSNKEILKQFAANGLWVAFIPEMTAVGEVESGKLKRLDWKGKDFPIYSQVFVHKDKHISKAIRGLLDIIENCE